MGRFHDRMDDDLRIRGYSANTRASYLRCVRHFVRHFMRPPDQLTPEHIRRYQLHLTRDRHVSWTYFNQIVCALRFFYRQVLKTDWAVAQIPYQRTGHTLPEILSPEEVAALLRATPNLKHRALLMTMYAGGLRVSEVTHLRVTDIDGQRMVIRIEQGKGNKDRYTLLSPLLLAELRRYYRVYRPTEWMFAQRRRNAAMDRASVLHVYYAAKRRAGIRKRGGIHVLRHSFATHLLESGTDLVTIQRLLGHAHVETTSHYLHLTRQVMAERASPLEQLALDPVEPA